MNEKLDDVACQYRFWKHLGKYAPEVREDLFDRDRSRMWNDVEWSARWERFDPDNPRGTGPHPAALEWCDRWELPDWCMVRAEHALMSPPSRQLRTAHVQDMDRWRKAVRYSFYYYMKPPPFEFRMSLWPAGSAYEPLTKEECRERILMAATKAADEYFDKHVDTFGWFEREEHRTFDEHCRWLILYLFLGLNDQQIAMMKDPTGNLNVNTVCARRKAVAALLGIKLPDRRGRPRKYQIRPRK